MVENCGQSGVDDRIRRVPRRVVPLLDGFPVGWLFPEPHSISHRQTDVIGVWLAEASSVLYDGEDVVVLVGVEFRGQERVGSSVTATHSGCSPDCSEANGLQADSVSVGVDVGEGGTVLNPVVRAEAVRLDQGYLDLSERVTNISVREVVVRSSDLGEICEKSSVSVLIVSNGDDDGSSTLEPISYRHWIQVAGPSEHNEIVGLGVV